MATIGVSNTVNNYTEIEYQRVVDAIAKYYNTLSKVGYIPQKEGNAVLIYTFLLEFYQRFYSIMSIEDKQEMFIILGCIDNKSCVFNN